MKGGTERERERESIKPKRCVGCVRIPYSND